MSIARHIDESAPGDGLWWGWLTVGLVGAIDSVWAWHTGFDFHGFPQAILIVGTLVTIGLYYGYSGRNPRFRDLGHYLALWLVFPLALNIYSYLAATLHFPLCDAQLSALDESLGFHWLLWARPIYAHKVAKLALLLAYDSIFLQGFASVAFFALTGNTQRNRELLWIAMLAGIATVVISGFAPALGPMTAGHVPEWTKVLLKLRDGSMTSTALWNMNGIVAFPSFHTVLGVVFIYVHRPPSWTFIPIAVLNSAVLVATPFMGHHYLIDVFAGAAITMLAIIAYRLATAPARERSGIVAATRPVMAMQQAERH
jgi:hypothetical protein